VAGARAALGEEQYRAEWAAGAEMTLDAVVARAAGLAAQREVSSE